MTDSTHAWKKHCAELRAFKRKYGHTNVPRKYPTNKALRGFVQYYRNCYKNNTLPQAKINELNAVGFIWDPIQYLWSIQFNELQAYQQKYGHTNVPAKSTEYPTLSNWVHNTRSRYKEKLLSQCWINKLNTIGFTWHFTSPNAWEKQYAELQAFKQKFGHTQIPWQPKESLKLARWVAKNRYNYKHDKLSQERIDKLNAIGFVWEIVKLNTT
tara:strand:- start:1704 stop:2339 length:636 start_codon:yes stop_codon:yes gene_type:complete